jgi:membrane protease YdiL (CAAX protease family)
MPIALAFYAVLLVLAAVFAWAMDRPLLYASENAARRGIAPLPDIAAGSLAAALVIAASRLITRWTRWGEALARALAALIGRQSTTACLVLAAASGLAEEAFFRGALQPQVGIVAASLLFGLAHFAPRRDLWPWTLFSIAAGFTMGALFEWTGNLVAPVVAHAGINAVNLRDLSRRYAPGVEIRAAR